MFQVYLLQSVSKNNYYIGQTDNIEGRIKKHNKGEVISTKNGVPWRLLGYEEYKTRKEARWREYNLKHNYTEKKKFIKKFI